MHFRQREQHIQRPTGKKWQKPVPRGFEYDCPCARVSKAVVGGPFSYEQWGSPGRFGSGGMRQLEPQAFRSLWSRGWGEGLGLRLGYLYSRGAMLVFVCKASDGSLGESIFKEQRNSQELCLLLIIIKVIVKTMTSLIKTADTDMVLTMCQSVVLILSSAL